MASEIKVDTISEKTAANGVTIDGLLIKDGAVEGKTIDVEYVIVAGGGGGGRGEGNGNGDGAGGGGAGGVLTGTVKLVPSTNYTVTIGGGGSAGNSGALATNGSNSIFGDLIAIGGGAGGSDEGPGSGEGPGFNGGSGGGASNRHGGSGYFGGTAVFGQGHSGGHTKINASSNRGGAGGGGAGGDGWRRENYPAAGAGSTGGQPIFTDITGTEEYLAGGGGGGASGSGQFGYGGRSSGGNGANSSNAPGAGTTNTGGGSFIVHDIDTSGTNSDGAAGASGIIYLKFLTSLTVAESGLTKTTSTVGSNTIYKITAATGGTIAWS